MKIFLPLFLLFIGLAANLAVSVPKLPYGAEHIIDAAINKTEGMVLKGVSGIAKHGDVEIWLEGLGHDLPDAFTPLMTRKILEWLQRIDVSDSSERL